MTKDEAFTQAKILVQTAKEMGSPQAFEVVQIKGKGFDVQPFGMHTLFKTHKLIEVFPIAP